MFPVATGMIRLGRFPGSKGTFFKNLSIMHVRRHVRGHSLMVVCLVSTKDHR